MARASRRELLALGLSITIATLAACGDVTQVTRQLAFTVQPSDGVAGQEISPAIQVTIEDAFGHRVRGATDLIRLTLGTAPSAATLSGTVTANAVDGVASFSDLSINRADPRYTLVASATGLPSVTSHVFAISVAPARLVFSAGPSGDVTAGMRFTPAVAVTIEDSLGNPVPTASNVVTISIGANPGGGVLVGPTQVSATNGVATFGDLSIYQAGVGYTLAASSSGLAGATLGPFTVVPAAATRLVFTGQPSTTRLMQAITPAVEVSIEDPFDNVVLSATDSVTVFLDASFNGGTLGGIQTARAENGVATFATLTVDAPGEGYALWGRAPGLADARSTTFRVLLTFAAVSAGGHHTCGVSPAGGAYCWGGNGLGGLGNGTLASSAVPTAISGGLRFAVVSAGTYYTCGVTTAGAAYCWGDNVSGQLGTGSTTHSPTPVAVSGGLTFAAVSARSFYTCGATTAGAAYCWGSSSTTGSTVPVAVPGGLTFASVTAGGYHACGVTLAGAAFCWGDNTYGQHGDGTTINSTAPVAVSGGLTFAAVSAGSYHTCGVTTAGVAYCWGYNASGQLGNSTTADSGIPVAVSGGLTFAAVSASYSHSCAVTPAGAAHCWGDNTYGQLGNGTTIGSTAPVAVSGGLTFTSVTAGDSHACGVTIAGAAYCWGDNRQGRLGNGTTAISYVPVRVVQ